MVLAGALTGQRMGDLITLPWAAVDLAQNRSGSHTARRATARDYSHAPDNPCLPSGTDKREAGKAKPSAAIWPKQSRLYEQSGTKAFSNKFYEEVLLPAGLVAKRTHHAKKTKAGEARMERRAVNEVSFHCLRHTFVSLLKLTGASQSAAKELAGHGSDEISDLYTHNDEATLTRAIKQLPPIVKG